jgi:5-methyltetrahydropteroyltriglutamate--homocysteine methyltransferase
MENVATADQGIVAKAPRTPARSDHVGSLLRPPELLAEVHRILIEWEDVEREGDFSALRYVPSPGPIVVLGVLSSKERRVETEDELLRRIDEALQYVPIEQLAISPQCGFASALSALGTTDGNELDEDVQWRKLEVQARVVERVWGT